MHQQSVRVHLVKLTHAFASLEPTAAAIGAASRLVVNDRTVVTRSERLSTARHQITVEIKALCLPKDVAESKRLSKPTLPPPNIVSRCVAKMGAKLPAAPVCHCLSEPRPSEMGVKNGINLSVLTGVVAPVARPPCFSHHRTCHVVPPVICVEGRTSDGQFSVCWPSQSLRC